MSGPVHYCSSSRREVGPNICFLLRNTITSRQFSGIIQHSRWPGFARDAIRRWRQAFLSDCTLHNADSLSGGPFADNFVKFLLRSSIRDGRASETCDDVGRPRLVTDKPCVKNYVHSMLALGLTSPASVLLYVLKRASARQTA